MKAVAAYPAGLEDRIAGTGYHKYLPQIGTGLDVTGLLQQVGLHAARGLTEELGNVENPKSIGTEARREDSVRYVPGVARLSPREQLEIEGRAQPVISQSGAPADRRSRSWGTGLLQPLALRTTGKPQRRQTGALSKPVRPGQKRIGQPLHADGGVGAVPAVHHRGIR